MCLLDVNCNKAIATSFTSDKTHSLVLYQIRLIRRVININEDDIVCKRVGPFTKAFYSSYYIHKVRKCMWVLSDINVFHTAISVIFSTQYIMLYFSCIPCTAAAHMAWAGNCVLFVVYVISSCHISHCLSHKTINVIIICPIWTFTLPMKVREVGCNGNFCENNGNLAWWCTE